MINSWLSMLSLILLTISIGVSTCVTGRGARNIVRWVRGMLQCAGSTKGQSTIVADLLIFLAKS
jgi:hypothetical protein